MRKLLLAVLILVMIAVPSVYADDVTVDLAGGVKANSGLGTELGIGFGTWGGNSSFIFSLGIDAEADIFFNAHHGMYVGAGFLLNIQNGTNVAYDVGIGYAYKEYFDDFNLIVTAGPHVTDNGLTGGRFGVEGNVYLDFYFARDWFMRAGAGLTMDFLAFGGGNVQGGFQFAITGPYLGFGYSF